MKSFNPATLRNYASAALLLFTFLVAAPNTNARHRAIKAVEQPAKVIAHLVLPGASVRQLVVEKRDGKQYLYIAQRSNEGFTIIDVTDPNQPSVIKRVTLPNEASAGKLQVVGGGLALAEAREADSTATETIFATETLTVLDLSAPKNPRTIQSFSGVTNTLRDDARNLVYFTNADGLWILKLQPERPAASEDHGCRSEDALNEFGNCQ